MSKGQQGKGRWRLSGGAVRRLVVNPAAITALILALAAGGRAVAASSVGHSPSDSSRATATFTVQADIDGVSQLILTGKTARWFQIDDAAPGVHNGQNNPTIINGVQWFPKWPKPGENRNCHCYSSTYTNLQPRVPAVATGVFVKAVTCRDICSASYSDGRVVITFNDNRTGSDAWYTVLVTLQYDVRDQGSSGDASG